MDERINELESIALAARANKGRMDAASREKASALIASIWADSSLDPEPSLSMLEDLKAEAIAEALRRCWPEMDVGRRNLFRKWVPTPSSEKSYRRLTFLVASIIEMDGATALHWLGLLIPAGRKNLAKESRETLASILFGERVLSFDALVAERANFAELLRICHTLFDVAADPSLSVSAMTRLRLGSAIFGCLAGSDAQKETFIVADLRLKITADSKKWPPALREMIPVGEVKHDPLRAESPDVAPDAQPEKIATPETPQPTLSSLRFGTLQEELPRLDRELSSYISVMTREVDRLRRTHEFVAKLVESANRMESQREASNRELQRVQQSLRNAETERDKAKSDLMRTTQTANELSAALEQMKADTENERRRLGQQISANANGRIAEFKNRLGLNLSRLVVDLPGKDVPVNAELGKVLLLQFHQFLDALRQEGIETLSTRLAS